MHRTLATLFLAACATATVTDAVDTGPVDTGNTDTSAGVDQTVCVSDAWWNGGDHESPFMHPGVACIECHQRKGGPGLTVGGTVFTRLHEPDDCDGRSGVDVEIIGADDKVTTLVSNGAGNFYVRGRNDIVFPIRARVTVGDVTKEMVTPQASGDCNSCHSVDGASLAPGRIIVDD